jgi:hypothetical protein
MQESLVPQKPQRMFPDVVVLGEFTPAKAVSKLKEMGDDDAGSAINTQRRGRKGMFWSGEPKAYSHTSHQFGYIGIGQSGSAARCDIKSAGAIDPDEKLKNARINIHLDKLHVYQYPGRGTHRVMFTFKAQNQLPESPEPISFSQTYRVRQGETAGIAGYPIFIGLNVGTLGAAFQGFTVNVKNDDDEALLGFLESSPFQAGLNLLTTVQPALKPFTEMTLGVAKGLANRNKNVPVQDFYLGLDFAAGAMGARLAVGEYLAVQVPSDAALNWDEWNYSLQRGAIVSKKDQATTIPYNYVVFRVTRYET